MTPTPALRTILSLALSASLGLSAVAQRPGVEVRPAPRPQAPSPAPRPSAPAATPRPSAPVDTPRPTPAPRPSYTPTPSAPRPSATPRPTPAPRPTYTPPAQPQPTRSPGVTTRPTPAPRPSYTPPAQPEPTRSPGTTRPTPTPRPTYTPPAAPTRTPGGSPRPTYTPRPSYTPPSDATPGGYVPPRPTSRPPTVAPTMPDMPGATPRPNPRPAPPAVGGPARPLGSSSAGRSSVRTIYERPDVDAGSGASPTPGATPAPTSRPRPVTGADLDTRYGGGRAVPRPAPGADAGAAPRPNARPGARGDVRTDAGNRYVGARPRGGEQPNARPGATPAPRPNVRPAANPRVTPAATAGAPRLQPRASVPPGVLIAAGAGAPRLLPRSGYAGRVGGRHRHGGLYYTGSGWSAWWNCNAALTYGLSGAVCWSYGAPVFGACWYSAWDHTAWCHDSWYYRHTWSWWTRPCYATAWWWWPSWCYVPTSFGYYAPSTSHVIVVEREVEAPARVEVVHVGGEARVPAEPAPEPTAADLAQRYVNLGDFYFREERFAEAAEAYARARTYAPDDPSLHFLLADAAFATGDYHFAAFLIAEALRLEPAMARAEADKRLFYGKPASFEAQLARLRAYLEEKPYDAMGWLVLGYNLKFAAQPEAALAAFQRVLAMDPENRAAQLFTAALAPAEPAPAPAAGERKDG